MLQGQSCSCPGSAMEARMLRVFAVALVGYFTYRIPTEFIESVP